jgi:hypothetical protein
MAIKHAKIYIPAKAGIFSMPGQGLQEDPGFRQDDRIVGLLGCRSNKFIRCRLDSQDASPGPGLDDLIFVVPDR